MSAWEKYRGLAYLAGLLVVVPWLVYSFAIAGTVRLGRELKRTEKEIALLESGRSVDTGGEAIVARGASGLQDGGVISRMMDCEAGGRCAVVRYTPYITETREGLSVHTAELTLSGGYADLLRLVERVETQAGGGRLVSAMFRSVRQRQRRQTQLQVTLILQQITENT